MELMAYKRISVISNGILGRYLGLGEFLKFKYDPVVSPSTNDFNKVERVMMIQRKA